MIDKKHDLPIARQAKALKLSRGSVYYLPRPVPAADLAMMRRMDALHLEFPFAGSRMLRDLLNAEGFETGRRHVVTLMSSIYRLGVQDGQDGQDKRPSAASRPILGENCPKNPEYACLAQ